jgi:hypothetical protein
MGDIELDEDIKITPKMIDAGVSILRASGRLAWNVEEWVAAELAQDIFRAMHHQGGRHHEKVSRETALRRMPANFP